MHEAIYNAQGRFHISGNKADMRDLFHFPYNLLKQLYRKHIGILYHARVAKTSSFELRLAISIQYAFSTRYL